MDVGITHVAPLDSLAAKKIKAKIRKANSLIIGSSTIFCVSGFFSVSTQKG